MKKRLKGWVRGAARPLGKALARLGVHADAVTLAGLGLAFVAAYGFWSGNRLLAFWALLGSALCDLLDGAVARAGGGRGTSFGAALDSTLDRYGEGLVMGAILCRMGLAHAPVWLLLLGVTAWIGSFLVSYVRARSEGLGIPCEVGLMERPERLVLLLALALWGDAGAKWILGLLTVLTHITFIHRLLHVRARAAGQLSPAPGPRSGRP